METKEELDNLLEESSMPLKSLLAQYDTPLQEENKGKVVYCFWGSGVQYRFYFSVGTEYALLYVTR